MGFRRLEALADSSPRERSFQVNGYKIAAVEYGDPSGLPVLALHGWLDNAASFAVMAEHLQGISLLALDLVGHGFSDHRPEKMPYHIWDNVTDLAAVIDRMELETVHLLGHSMGASIAMLYSGIFPERVKRLGLIDGLAPLVYPATELPELFADALLKRNKMASRAVRPYKAFSDAVAARMRGNWPLDLNSAELIVGRGVAEAEEGFIWRHDPRLLMPSLVRFSDEQVEAFVAAVEAETFVISATDGIAPKLIGRWITMLKSVDHITLEGGHHLHMTEPAARDIAALVNRWAE